jgi:hypothetical protein
MAEGSSHPAVPDSGICREALETAPTELRRPPIVACAPDVNNHRDSGRGELSLNVVKRAITVPNGPDRGRQTSLLTSFANAGQMS